MPPNYERIDKETHRWFGEYRYKKLAKRFERCDTSMTIDHFRCLYYGAAMRGDTAYTITAQQSWWQRVEMIQAVWSSGNGTDTLPFHVACYADARFMRDDTGDSNVHCMLMGKPLWRKLVEPVEPLQMKTSKEIFGEQDSLGMVRMGVLPTAEQQQRFRDLRAASGNNQDSLIALLADSYKDIPDASVWVELQAGAIHAWDADDWHRAIDRHPDDSSALFAELYLHLAQAFYEYATKYHCDQCFDSVLWYCNHVVDRWPQSDAAAQCRALLPLVSLPEVKMQNAHQQHISPLPASRWALTTLWHRNADSVWLAVYTFEDTLFRKPLYQWPMAVIRHRDLHYHEAYVYLPPMPEGRYLLRASADKEFRAWACIELLRSDRRLFVDYASNGVVVDNVTGRPVKGFKVSLMDYAGKEEIASVRTDRNGRFSFSRYEDEEGRLRAMYHGIDLAGNTLRYTGVRSETDTIAIINEVQPVDTHHYGDTVHLRCIIASADGPLAGVRQTFTLSGYNSFTVYDSITLVSDEHGECHFSFVLPMDSNDVSFEVKSMDFWDEGPMLDVDDRIDNSLLDIDYHRRYVGEEDSRGWDSLEFYYLGGPRALPADVALRVERLRQPEGHWLNPEALSMEAEHSIDETEYRRRYPWYAYHPRQNSTNLWEADSVMYTTRQQFEAAKHHAFALPPLPAGIVYRTHLTAYEADTVSAEGKVTLYDGRLPVVGMPVNVRIDTLPLAIGDTLRIHLESWLTDQWLWVQVMIDRREGFAKWLHINNEDYVLQLPLKREGVVRVEVCGTFMGQPTLGKAYWFVGELGRFWRENYHSTLFHKTFLTERVLEDVGSRRSYFHRVHRPQPLYPERHEAIPSVWRWLGLERPQYMHLFCPYEYSPWRNFGQMKYLPR